MSESNGLPQGWTFTTIGEVAASIQYGHTASAIVRADGPRFLRITDIQNGRVDWSSVPSCEVSETDLPKYQLEVGDIVFARTGATTGKSYLIHHCPKAIFASYLIRLRMASGLNPSYLHAFWRQIEEGKRGIGQPNVNAKTLAQIEFPVAPLNEQHRIVAEIETQFTRLDASVAALQRVQANLKRYRASVLQAACEGRLVPTEAELARAEGRSYEPADQLLQRILQERRAKWESDQLASMTAKGKVPKDDKWKSKYKQPVEPDTSELPELPEGWVWTTLDQLSYHVTSGSRGWAKYYSNSGSLFVRVGNFNRFKTAIDLQDVVFVNSPSGPEADRTRLQVGDLLITITADVGMVSVVDKRVLQWQDAFINQHVGLVRLVFNEIAVFLAFALMSELLQAQIRKKQYGATKAGLGLDDLRSLTLPFPPLTEQHRTIAEVERRFSVIDELEVTIQANLKRADRLRQSILKRAFEGKLVPQDPTDEPASILLERIRDERARRTKEEKSRKKSKGRTMPKGPSKKPQAEETLPLFEALSQAKESLTPKQLFEQTGHSPESIDQFYEELKQETIANRIIQERPNNTDVYLKAADDEAR
jgi:type I restriction enzyme S subunit